MDAAIKVVASDPSLTSAVTGAGGRENLGEEPEKPETEAAVEARTAAGEPRVIGSPLAYRAPVLESQRAADIKGGLMDSMHLCLRLFEECCVRALHFS